MMSKKAEEDSSPLKKPEKKTGKKVNFMILNEKAYIEFEPQNEIKPVAKKIGTNLPKKALLGLSKNILVSRFSSALKARLKLHALDDRQFKFINDKAFDKSNENAVNRQLLKKKLMKDVSETFFEKKANGCREKITLKIIGISKNLAIRWSMYAHREMWMRILKPAKYMIKVHIPDGVFRLTFDIICLILIVWEILMIPLVLSFPEIDVDFVLNMEAAITIFFLCDIFLNFNTGFYERGNLVLKRKVIAQHYIKSWFVIDTFGSFPFDWVFPTDNSQNSDLTDSDTSTLFKVLRFAKFLKILRLLRALKLKKIFGKLEDYLQLSMTFNAILACMRLCFLMICIAHWFACIWHLIAVFETNDFPNTWLTVTNVENADWNIRYIYSIYWAITTMVTVGYGDVVPITPIEKVYAIICMLLACGIFGYIMNRIGSIFSSFEENSFEYKIKLLQINQYMRKKNIPKSMQVKVRKYIQYTYDPDKKKQMDESAFFQCLSINLQTELSEYMNGNILVQFKLLSKILSQKMLTKLATSFKEHIYGPEEVVISSKEIISEEETYLYFLYRGIACSYYEDCDIVLTILKDGASFGEVGFFTRFKRLASVKSLDFIYVYTISNEIFLSITEKERLKEDKEVYFEIKDNLELNHDYRCLDITCYSCGQTDHLISNCPYLHYVIKPEELLYRHNIKESYFRKGFKRNPNKKRFNAFSNFILIQSSALAVMNTLRILKQEGGVTEFPSEEELDENMIGIMNSFNHFTRFKEENNFDEIIKLKSKEIDSPIIVKSSDRFGLAMRVYTEPQLPKIALYPMSPNKKSNYFSPKTSKSKITVQNFTEAAYFEAENDGKEEEENKIINFESNKTFCEHEYGESFQIDKIENFTKYFPKYNFDEISKKINDFTKMKSKNFKAKNSVRNDETNAKIELMKKKTIRVRKEQFLNLSASKENIFYNEKSNEESEMIHNEVYEKKNEISFSQEIINLDSKIENLENSAENNNNLDYDKILGSLEMKKVEEWIKKRKK